MFHLLESNHITEKNTLDNLNQQDTYHEELFELRKRQLNEYTDLLETFKNNYVHSLYENTISLTKHNRNSRSSSVFSGKASLYSSTDEIDKISLDDAPDYLLDPISYELFIDPVISPSGITYEKATLIDHLQKNGKFDPITRQALHEDQLYPNLIMKDTVEAYIEQNRYVN
ncbi:hypothetical protein G210_1304 [Candida maltosa Xu316]|uniref:RING-type E3 ubiquitin transferase n=1 Tax=Candida maltosa (strain Xu316) TaxID=1245528 RepID=M3JYV8_CANMX|nr:hypothetical protein G210_1304 [Candida maltosa Xu316]